MFLKFRIVVNICFCLIFSIPLPSYSSAIGSAIGLGRRWDLCMSGSHKIARFCPTVMKRPMCIM